MPLRVSVACMLAVAAVPSLVAADEPPVTIEVDAREAPRRIIHARLTVPASSGSLTLAYPKWLPGEHGPTGPISDMAGLRVSANGRGIAWHRDPVDMYAIHVDVPQGSAALEVALDYLAPADTGGFTSGGSTSENLAVLSWNQVLLYPKGRASDSVTFAASLRLPAGWKFGTALRVAREAGGRVEFAPVSLSTLVDSPVLMGAHFRTLSLLEEPIRHEIHVAADSEAALAMPSELQAAYKRLVAETGSLFGARHYRAYSFLLTLSDHVAHFGLEHHESSDNRVGERGLIDEDARRVMSGLLSHEMTHSWNGKYRRPAGLATPDYEQPMVGELLWVYEGLTQYLGQVLAARSGLLSNDDFRENLALTAADMDHQRGREWRPLADTAMAAQILFGTPSAWRAWRRGVDFYPESVLLWLEADTVIRRESKGKKSLDDFCRLFHGGETGPPKVVPYTFEDVVAALDRVTPYDWRGFWRERLDVTTTGAPMGGIAASGWRLAYTDTVPRMQRAVETLRRHTDVRYSIGVSVAENGALSDVVPGSPADKAGMGPGMSLVAVNGRKWNRERLREAIRESKAGRAVELLVENDDFFRTYRLDYNGGERYPRLEAEAGKPDVLGSIIRPLGPSGAGK